MDGQSSATNLVEYGILQEQSDLRVHVCPIVRRVYVYPTDEGRNVCLSGKWPKKPGFQEGVSGPTAEGFLVPPLAIPKCVALEVRNQAWKAAAFDAKDDTTTKGRKAVNFVAAMIRGGIFPLPYLSGCTQTELSEQVQIDGDDIIVVIGAGRFHIQVKCDYRGGPKEMGGTGNLFLQVAERNPLQKH